MAGHRGRVDAALHARLEVGPVDPELRSRIAIALLPSDPDRATELADRLLACGPEEHRAIREALRPRRAEIAPRLRAVLDDPGSDPTRRIRAAAALIAFDEADSTKAFAEAAPAWEQLRAAEVPDLRVELMDWLVRSRIRAGDHRRPPRSRARRVRPPRVIQVLAELDDGGRPPAASSPALIVELAAMYRDDPDPGVHSSLGYLFVRWGLTGERAALDAERAGRPPDDRRWFVNTIGQTFAVVGPVEPSPASPPRRLAIATTETTVEQFRRFDPGHRSRADRMHGPTPPRPEMPVAAVSYDEACAVLQPAQPGGRIPASGLVLPPGRNARERWSWPRTFARRRGYRLLTLREWEYAARAGTTTDRYFGRLTRHADAYAWYNRNTDNHAEPVGRKRPNDFGLFDTLGNLLEWCYNPDPPHDDLCKCPAVKGADCRKSRFVSVRGGSYSQAEGGLTVAAYSPTLDRMQPDETLRYIGFRVVRSVP